MNSLQAGLVLIGAGAALAITALLGARLIRRPLNRLLIVADRWGTGDLAARTGMRHDNSMFGRLAEAFDRMAVAQEARERSLRESEERFRGTFEQAAVGFIHAADPRSVFEVTEEEREAFWEKRYGEPGFGIWMGNFRDVLVDREANKLMSDYLARKISERVKDPAVAEKLVPKTHGFGTRRVPLESGYFEVYNQPNVTLVDLTETPIERITPEGIGTSDADYRFDVIIYATGFDAITGAFDQIDIRGVGRVSLKDKWANGPVTLLGILVDGFPNFMMVMGPHAGLGNFPRAVEYTSDWVTALIRHACDNGLTRVDATPEAAKKWTDHII